MGAYQSVCRKAGRSSIFHLFRRCLGQRPLLPPEMFSATRRVSIWVGDIHSGDRLDRYLRRSHRFEKDFGFEMDEHNPPEATAVAAPMPVATLLEGFSCWRQFVEDVTAAAARQRIGPQTCAVALYSFEYTPDRIRKHIPSAPMRFLGTFELK